MKLRQGCLLATSSVSSACLRRRPRLCHCIRLRHPLRPRRRLHSCEIHHPFGRLYHIHERRGRAVCPLVHCLLGPASANLSERALDVTREAKRAKQSISSKAASAARAWSLTESISRVALIAFMLADGVVGPGVAYRMQQAHTALGAREVRRRGRRHDFQLLSVGRP